MPFVKDNLRHLRQGSTCPEFANGSTPILYNLRFSPYCERVRLLLNYKEIPFHVVNIHIRDKPDWFLQKNPIGKVPTLQEEDGTIIYESLILAEYLDDKYRQHPLLPKDPLQRALQKQAVEAIIQTAAYKHTILDGDPAGLKVVENGLDGVENLLKSNFWAGESLGFVDLMVWPWFERLPAIRQLSGLDFTATRHPKITAWMDRMLTVPAVAATAYSTEERTAFLDTRKSGAINFDIGL